MRPGVRPVVVPHKMMRLMESRAWLAIFLSGLAAGWFGCSKEAAPNEPQSAARSDDGGTNVNASSVVEPTGNGKVDAGDGCIQLGGIQGTAFTAHVEPASRWFWAAVPGQNTPAKIGVIATGDPVALKGQTASLGTGANADYATCTHCLPMVLGCTGDDCTGARWFFPRGGSATFTSTATLDGESFAGHFDDVLLREVSINPDTLVATDLPGGACFRFTSVTFSATADLGVLPGVDGGDDDGGTDGSVSSSGGSGGGGKKLDGGVGVAEPTDAFAPN